MNKISIIYAIVTNFYSPTSNLILILILSFFAFNDSC